MFSLRKAKNRERASLAKSPPAYRRGNGFHPRFESLEDRALPSITLLSLNVPVVAVIGDAPVSFSFVVRFEFITPSFLDSGGAAASMGRDTSSPAARLASVNQPAVNQAAVQAAPTQSTALNAPQASVSQSTSAAAGSSRATAAAAASNPIGEIASLFAFTSSPSSSPARPVVVKPTAPEGQSAPLSILIAAADQPAPVSVVAPGLLPAPVTPESRLVQPQLPVQAIGNRMEFIGSAAGVVDTTAEGDKPSAPAVQQPADPSPMDSDEVDALGGMLGLPLSEAVLTDNSWSPDAMDLGTLCGQTGEERVMITPELATEVAVLAACVGGLPVGPRTPARRGDLTRNRLDIEGSYRMQ
jgi:hypothetical protein